MTKLKFRRLWIPPYQAQDKRKRAKGETPSMQSKMAKETFPPCCLSPVHLSAQIAPSPDMQIFIDPTISPF
ncbi:MULTISPECIES: hypothetical protein [Bacillus]|uniref:Uncharacterized protein n=1 Tax=Bacillus glycinifermentans TaxID=1664069 RepID=A0AAJ4D1U4_9BACI|nr:MULTISPECIES: hypothetical protein [Bacillus]KKB73292.1 hypothetical protein TH62_12390 [Bacillus sp. TH008]MBU8787295.1 hypothetical protein [Bacillus glycinifermentans]MDU0069494.1 hypothetical protein [Bacillus sp. IG6]MED8017526.1 hypothetical protein [Bacillus glycinifermentans]NUJ19638.1 hypothetical protein [Bacillus glycinifermentans]